MFCAWSLGGNQSPDKHRMVPPFYFLIMNKWMLIIIFNCLFLSVHAKINYEVNKYGVMFVYFVYEDSLPTIDIFKQDWESAITIASTNNKVKQIQFKNGQNELIVWLNRNQLLSWEKEYEKIIGTFPSDDITEPIYGDSVLSSYTVPAQYHIDEYINGQLKNTYVSDWNGGRMAPKTSTYTTGRDKYVTKTYVVPAHKINQWVRPKIGYKTIRKAEDLQLEKLLGIYKKIQK